MLSTTASDKLDALLRRVSEQLSDTFRERQSDFLRRGFFGQPGCIEPILEAIMNAAENGLANLAPEIKSLDLSPEDLEGNLSRFLQSQYDAYLQKLVRTQLVAPSPEWVRSLGNSVHEAVTRLIVRLLPVPTVRPKTNAGASSIEVARTNLGRGTQVQIRRKLQVFISSTYLDMQKERQAAVRAVLSAGHIPAGMELFAAGDESQIQVVKKWIDESDVLMLLLGGRYGSVEPKSGKSYTELEYAHAVERGIPVLALVMSDTRRATMAAHSDSHPLEIDKPEYVAFKNAVLSKMCQFFDDTKDIEIEILKALKHFEERHESSGWVSGKDYDTLLASNATLEARSRSLEATIDENKVGDTSTYMSGHTFGEILEVLNKTEVTYTDKKKGVDRRSIFEWLNHQFRAFAIGVTNRSSSDAFEVFLFHTVGPFLMTMGLVSKTQVPGTWGVQQIQLSDDGFRFLGELRIRAIHGAEEH